MHFGHDYDNQLAIRAKVSPAATTHFIHDLWGNVLAETNGTATGTTREYIWLPEVEIAPADGARSQVDRPIAVVNAVNTATPATWYVSVDHLNRPIQMTDAAKASVWAAVWQPWGGVHSNTGTASLDARLPGQWFQAETGLHYNWHRQYDPTVGRYTQPDPLGFVDGPSVYGYAKGAPQSLLDKDGRNSGTFTGGRIGGAIGGPGGVIIGAIIGTAIVYYCSTNDNDCQKRLDNRYLKRLGFDAEEIKREYLGNRVKTSLYELCQCNDGTIAIRNLGCVGPTTRTHYNVYSP